MRSDDCSIEASGLKVGLKKICEDRPEQSDARTHRRGGWARAKTRNISKAKGPDQPPRPSVDSSSTLRERRAGGACLVDHSV